MLIDCIERIMSTTVTAGTAACLGLTIIFAIVLSGCSSNYEREKPMSEICKQVGKPCR
jgi:hypothetical protein